MGYAESEGLAEFLRLLAPGVKEAIGAPAKRRAEQEALKKKLAIEDFFKAVQEGRVTTEEIPEKTYEIPALSSPETPPIAGMPAPYIKKILPDLPNNNIVPSRPLTEYLQPIKKTIPGEPARQLTTPELFDVYGAISRGEVPSGVKVSPKIDEGIRFSRMDLIRATPSLINAAKEAIGADIGIVRKNGVDWIPRQVLTAIANAKKEKIAYQYKTYINTLTAGQKESAVNKYAVDLAHRDLLVMPGTMRTPERQKALQERIEYYKKWLSSGEFQPLIPVETGTSTNTEDSNPANLDLSE